MLEPALVADIGGTYCRMALAVGRADGLVLEQLRLMPTPQGDFVDAAREYLHNVGCERPSAIAVAAAGRVRRVPGRNWVSLTNTNLRVERESLAGLCGDRVWLVNDLAAVAASLPALTAEHCAAFGPPRPAVRGLRLVVGVGTGFGAAALTVDDGLIETEAGHADLPAISAEERLCLNRLAPLGRLAVEQVLSGPGLLRLHEAMSGQRCADATDLRVRVDAQDAAALETLTLFSTWLGRVVGNLVLNFGAWGGVYLTGGVIAGLGHALDAQAFRRGLEDKAPFAADLGAVPVQRILHPQPALLGMARLALAG